METSLVLLDGTAGSADDTNVRRLLEAGTPFWLDLYGSGREMTHTLRDVFGFHPLAVEDAEHFHQRAKVDDYDDYVLIVMYGAPTAAHSGDQLVELHCFLSEKYLVTVHHAACPDLALLRQRLAQQPTRNGHTPIMLLHSVLDTLVDSFFPALARFDDEIDDLEDAILARPTDAQLLRLFEMKRSLIAIRKVVTPERDTMARVVTGVGRLPGMTPEAERYFRDIYDHLIRISDLVDSYRDLLSGALDTHLSTVSNRLNGIMKQLTVISTFFLPLTYLTGFFGQNFDFMINGITGPVPFFALGIGLDVLAVLALLVWFWVRGWLRGDAGGAPSASLTAGLHVRRRQRKAAA
jgi:magnesium transporter